MAELFSRYESGTQLTAGPIVGSAVGVSGVNAIVDRLNSITTDDGQTIGSFVGTVISGAGNSLYLSGGQIDRTPSAGDDIVNKTYSDSVGIINKSEGQLASSATSGTSLLTVNYTRTKPFHLTLWGNKAYYNSVDYRLAFFNGATNVGELTTVNTISGTWNSQTTEYHSSIQNLNTLLYIQTGGADSTGGNLISATSESRQNNSLNFSTVPDTIQLIATASVSGTNIPYEYYQT